MSSETHCLRERFLAWQCLIRQYSMRNARGRPTPAMQPTLRLPGETTGGNQVNVLIIKLQSQPHTAQMRHIVRKSQDPHERYESALRYLSATYFQRSREFSDHMTALFALDSSLARQLLESEVCTLDFAEKSHCYSIPCQARQLQPSEPDYQATYWHNSMFNPAMPGHVQILSLIPNWSEAHSDAPSNRG